MSVRNVSGRGNVRGEVSVGEKSMGEVFVGEMSIGEVSGWGNVRRGSVRWGSVRRESVRRGCVHRGNVCRGTVRTPENDSLRFDGLLLSKAYKVLDEKVQKSYIPWDWIVMQSLKKNWLLVPKMIWGIWWILMRAVASLRICTLMCYFCRKYIMFEPKKCTVAMCHNTEEWCKIWGGNDLYFRKWHEEFGEFLMQHSKVSRFDI